MLKPAIIGKDGRSSAIIKCLEKSPQVGVGGVVKLSDWKEATPEQAIAKVLEAARRERPDFVIVGPEAPLAAGVVDWLQSELGIPCVGPVKALAQLEASKAFTRALVAEFGIPGNPEYRTFHSMEGMAAYLQQLGEYVVKPDGLTGGKGVKVSGAHLATIEDGLQYAEELFACGHDAVVIEEKLDGEEFSLMSFCDGSHTVDMVPVQDHKRVGVDDTGPNTGGMGSYSCEDHRLPFVSAEMMAQASAINAAVGRALFQKTGQKYKGILYGGFMVTAKGLRLLEYNARFGDPETMNVLAVLETDLAAIFQAIISETLDRLPVRFRPLATVCKYIVPQGYPDAPVKGVVVDLSQVPPDSEHTMRFDAAVEQRPEGLVMTGSRALAFVGVGANLAEAERRAEAAASAVRGPVHHRPDIGTAPLVQRRVDHVKALGVAS